MSEPVDVVAAGREAVERIVCYDALSTQWNGRRDSDIVSELCDKVERLEAEVQYFKDRFTREADLGHAEIQGMRRIVERAEAETAEAEKLLDLIAKKLDYMPRVYGWQEQLVTDSLALIAQFRNLRLGDSNE